MTYPVQIVLDEGNLTVNLREIREWLDRHAVDPATLKYRMSANRVQLRIDFIALKDAAKFAQVFGGLVSGARRTIPTVSTARS